MNNILSAIGSILIAVAIFAIAGVAFTYQPLVKQWLSMEARHQCAQDYRMEFTQEAVDTVIIKPIDDLYQQCLADKGL